MEKEEEYAKSGRRCLFLNRKFVIVPLYWSLFILCVCRMSYMHWMTQRWFELSHQITKEEKRTRTGPKKDTSFGRIDAIRCDMDACTRWKILSRNFFCFFVLLVCNCELWAAIYTYLQFTYTNNRLPMWANMKAKIVKRKWNSEKNRFLYFSSALHQYYY